MRTLASVPSPERPLGLTARSVQKTMFGTFAVRPCGRTGRSRGKTFHPRLRPWPCPHRGRCRASSRAPWLWARPCSAWRPRRRSCHLLSAPADPPAHRGGSQGKPRPGHQPRPDPTRWHSDALPGVWPADAGDRCPRDPGGLAGLSSSRPSAAGWTTDGSCRRQERANRSLFPSPTRGMQWGGARRSQASQEDASLGRVA
jgi:hypothetical protein